MKYKKNNIYQNERKNQIRYTLNYKKLPKLKCTYSEIPHMTNKSFFVN